MGQKNCIECQMELPDDAKFCDNCGASQSSVTRQQVIPSIRKREPLASRVQKDERTEDNKKDRMKQWRPRIHRHWLQIALGVVLILLVVSSISISPLLRIYLNRLQGHDIVILGDIAIDLTDCGRNASKGTIVECNTDWMIYLASCFDKVSNRWLAVAAHISVIPVSFAPRTVILNSFTSLGSPATNYISSVVVSPDRGIPPFDLEITVYPVLNIPSGTEGGLISFVVIVSSTYASSHVIYGALSFHGDCPS